MNSLQKVFKFLHPEDDFFFQLGKAGDDLFGRLVGYHLMDDLLVAIQREVVALGRNVGLRHAEALGCPGIPFLRSITLTPTG